MTERFISVHFPKAGGTSLSRQFVARFGKRHVLLDGRHHPLGPQAFENVTEFPPAVTLVHGHFRPSVYDAVTDARRLTFLRHPVDNLISHYFFRRSWKMRWLFRRGLIQERFLREHPTLEQFANFSEMRTLMSQAYFGGYDMTRFDFVGFHETRGTDIARLSALMGVALDPDLQANRTSEGAAARRAVQDDKPLMRRLAAALSQDIRFYETQRTRWS